MDLRPNQTQSCDTDVSDLVRYLLPIVTIVPAIAIPANAVVIRVLLTRPRICSTSEIFTLNMAAFDLLFCPCVLIEFYLLVRDPTILRTYFVAWGFNQAGGPTLLSLMSLDSYLGVCHPLLFLRLKNPNIRLLLCLIVNVFTASCCWSLKNSRVFKWQGLSAFLLLNFGIISACNVAVLRTLRKSGPGEKKKVHPVKKRAVRIVMTAFVLIQAHYVMPVMEYLIRTLDNIHCNNFTVLTSVAYTLLATSSITQPLSFLVRTNHKILKPCSENSR